MAGRVLSRTENVLFQINECNDVTLFPLISALQGYVSSAVAKHKAWASYAHADSALTLTVSLLISEEMISYVWLFRKLVPCLDRIVSSHTMLDLSSFDAIFSLDEYSARCIGEKTHKHLAISYGILIGGNSSSLPTMVENLVDSYTPMNKVLIHPQLAGHIEALGVRLDYTRIHFIPDGSPSLEERIRCVFSCAGIIAPLSLESYLASSLRKPVLELSTDSALTQWDNPQYYRMTFLSKFGVLKGINKCFPDLIQTAMAQ